MDEARRRTGRAKTLHDVDASLGADVEISTAELLMRGRELVRFLRGFSEAPWADWLEHCLDGVRRDPRGGVGDLLAGYDGFAGFTDLFLCPEAGHRLDSRDETNVNEQLLIMASRVYELAREISDCAIRQGGRARRS